MLINPAVIPTDLPTGAVAETFERRQQLTASAGTSGRLVLSAIYLRAGQPVASATFFSGTTALATGTHGWAALLDPNRNLLGQSADDTSVAWAANTEKTFTLTAPVAAAVSGWHYVGYLLVASTMPTVWCLSNNGATSKPPAMGGWSTTGLTDTAPATAAAPSAAPYPYAYVS